MVYEKISKNVLNCEIYQLVQLGKLIVNKKESALKIAKQIKNYNIINNNYKMGITINVCSMRWLINLIYHNYILVELTGISGKLYYKQSFYGFMSLRRKIWFKLIFFL